MTSDLESWDNIAHVGGQERRLDFLHPIHPPQRIRLSVNLTRNPWNLVLPILLKRRAVRHPQPNHVLPAPRGPCLRL